MPRMRPVATFSIVARDPDTGDLGVATASEFLAVGAVVPHAVAGVAAIATQSYANTSYGPRAVAALRPGVPLELVHRAFAQSDDQHAARQYGMVDAGGASVSFTGDGCHPWAGGRNGVDWAAQGNLLTGPEVVDELVRA